jgi:hypothetical protein
MESLWKQVRAVVAMNRSVMQRLYNSRLRMTPMLIESSDQEKRELDNLLREADRDRDATTANPLYTNHS